MTEDPKIRALVDDLIATARKHGLQVYEDKSMRAMHITTMTVGGGQRRARSLTLIVERPPQ